MQESPVKMSKDKFNIQLIQKSICLRKSQCTTYNGVNQLLLFVKNVSSSEINTSLPWNNTDEEHQTRRISC
jgi:hypothetical protein